MIGLLAPSGCARGDLRAREYADELGGTARQLRPAVDQSRLSGVDSRSREIERNLGVR
jgi:hypothetical protein